MKVMITGQFLENGSYHSQKTNTDVVYTILLVDATALQVTGIQQPPTVQRLDEVTMTVDIRAYGNQLSASYVPV
nr:MAG TPA: hypothetical protein [Inoviridae sp.]